MFCNLTISISTVGFMIRKELSYWSYRAPFMNVGKQKMNFLNVQSVLNLEKILSFQENLSLSHNSII